jgi:hypothetical protein
MTNNPQEKSNIFIHNFLNYADTVIGNIKKIMIQGITGILPIT